MGVADAPDSPSARENSLINQFESRLITLFASQEKRTLLQQVWRLVAMIDALIEFLALFHVSERHYRDIGIVRASAKHVIVTNSPWTNLFMKPEKHMLDLF